MATPYLPTEQAVAQSSPEVLGIERQRKLADLLTAQAFNQPQGQMISGHYVAPSWSQQLAPLASVLAGNAISERADTKQQELAATLRGQKIANIQKFAELQKTNPAAANEFGLASGDPTLIQIVQEKMKGHTLAKGAVHIGTDLAGNQTKLEGNPDLPDALQYAISVGGLPQNPELWNEQQRAYAKQLVESKARAGAGNIYNQMGKSIAGEIGPMMKEAQAIAQAAVKTEDSANRIIQAVNSNKLYSGTGANVRLGAAQIADTLGVGGKDLQTKIGNTRQAMQGLAQLTLEGRKQMRGEGQITNQESQLAERAISGDISFTPAEIKQLANAAKRSADYTYNTYQTKLNEMGKNQDTAGLVPYYQVPRMTQPVSGNDDGWSVKSVK